MVHGVRRGIAVAALAALGAGCATQEWTQTLFAKQMAEVDERFVKVDVRARQQGERIDRMDERLVEVDTLAREQRERADRTDERLVEVETDARLQRERIDRVDVRVAQLDTGLREARAQVRGALAQAPSTSIRSGSPERRVAQSATEPAPRRTLVGVIHVRFRFDRADLNAGAEAALATIAKELRENPTLTIDLEGATDPVGTVEYNLRLSQRRVEAVRRWLVANGVSRVRIVGSAGRGPIVDASVTDDAKRRVMVRLMTSAE